jgi:uncharacterized protein (TIGR02271 family)
VDPAEVERRPQAIRMDENSMSEPALTDEQTLELREEELIAHRELKDVGNVRVSKVVEEVPGRLELEAYSEEVEVEHVPIGKAVSERREPWNDDGVMVVPVYEEQLVVTKRLILREHLRIRRVATTRHELFEDTLRRERAVVEGPNDTELVHERYATGDEPEVSDDKPEAGVINQLVRKALQ